MIATCLATTPFEVLRIRAIDAASAEGSCRFGPEPRSDDGIGPELRSQSGPTTSLSASLSTPASLSAGAASTALASKVSDASSERAPDNGGGGSISTRTTTTPQPTSAYNLVNGLGTLYAEGGIGTLYSALTPLLLRELPFSITKFLVYDSVTQAIAAFFPLAQEGPLVSAVLSLTGGLAAGVVAAAVSTPADTLLTLSQSPPSGSDSNVEGSTREPPTMLQVASDT